MTHIKNLDTRKNLKVPEDLRKSIKKVAQANNRTMVGQLRHDYQGNKK